MLLLLTPFLIYSAPLDHLAQAENLNIIAQIMPGNSDNTEESPDVQLKKGGTFIIRGARFSGNNAVSTEELIRIANPYLNYPFSRKELRNLEKQIKGVYKGKGYKKITITSSMEKEYNYYVLNITIQEGDRNPALMR